MNRNQNSHFAYNPTNIDISRSKFKRDSSVKLTFNVGELIPFYVDEVLPGDTFNVSTSKIIRLQTLLTPMMDNVYVDFYWFFVPNRLVWDHWKEFNGENTASAWAPSVEYSVPTVSLAGTEKSSYAGSVADYMGIPKVDDADRALHVNALPFRSYGLVYSEWFRDENLIDPENIYTGDAEQSLGDLLGTGVRSYRAYPYLVSKYFDYFTSCLPAPQKGDAALVPFNFATEAPVITGVDHGIYSVSGGESMPTAALKFFDNTGEAVGGKNVKLSSSSNLLADSSTYSSVSPVVPAIPGNLWSDLNNVFGGVTINELRTAFQIQKLLEKDARGGTRYIEILKSHFGVTSPDYRLQRPEYLGGNRVPLNINQVIQQSETSASSPMGNTAAMSLTSDIHGDFTKSFTEHGILLGLMVARYDHTYQQGLERMWSRQTRFDYYWPVLANIGEQAVKNKEIYAIGTTAAEDLAGSGVDDEVFGYNEAWADYRYKPNRVAGEMRSNVTASLDVWHLADNYSSLPYLSKAWIQEDKSNVDRVLAVTSEVSNQIFADIYIRNMTTRPMPIYSIPGLIDHH